MANHWADYGSLFSEANLKLRLDPCHLAAAPQSVCYKGPESGRFFTAFLTERGVFIQRRGCAAAVLPRLKRADNSAAAAKCAPPRGQQQGQVLKIFAPRRFLGIAARKISLGGAGEAEAAAGQSGHTVFCLILLHPEADYSVPLLVSAGKDEVLLDWRLWADLYNLPMLIGENGRFRPPGGTQALKLFINDGEMRQPPRRFLLRCRGLSLNTRLVLANQIMLG